MRKTRWIKPFKGILKFLVKRALSNEDNKELVTEIVNKKVDLPKLTEEEEGKLIGQLYEAVQEAAIIVIDRM